MPKPVFHPDELALLAAIHSEPSDDTVRLVYADWLEENDQSGYAEFIRCSVRTPDCSIVADLARHHGQEWAGDTTSVVFNGRFDRGMPLVTSRQLALLPRWRVLLSIDATAAAFAQPLPVNVYNLHLKFLTRPDTQLVKSFLSSAWAAPRFQPCFALRVSVPHGEAKSVEPIAERFPGVVVYDLLEKA